MRHYVAQYRSDFRPLPDFDDLIARLHAAKTRHYTALLAEAGIPLRPGVRRLLEEARRHGVRLAIVTTTTPANVRALLRHALASDAERWFDVIAAGGVVAAKKPAPAIYHYILERLALFPTECVAFEGSENGLRASLAVGLTTIVTVNDYTRTHDFRGAALVLDHLGDPDRPCHALAGTSLNGGGGANRSCGARGAVGAQVVEPYVWERTVVMRTDDQPRGYLLTRREAVALLGAAGYSLLSGGSHARIRRAIATGAACVVRPEQTEGPYFVDELLNRSDLRADPSDGTVRPGVPLDLTFRVSRVAGDGCTPLAGVVVDVWHCDHLGVYSDVEDAGFNTVGRKFLRGYQVTDANGAARFTTIYPGWYEGRTVHVHFKLRAPAGARPGFAFTSQLYFDDALTDRVHAQPPYAVKGRRNRRNH